MGIWVKIRIFGQMFDRNNSSLVLKMTYISIHFYTVPIVTQVRFLAKVLGKALVYCMLKGYGEELISHGVWERKL
jgi:hypothetical protein